MSAAGAAGKQPSAREPVTVTNTNPPSTTGYVRADTTQREDQMAKNTGKGHRRGAVKARSEFQHNGTWFKRDSKTGQILNGSPHQHKGVRNEK